MWFLHTSLREGTRNRPIVVCLHLVAEEAEACREERRQVCAAQYLQQRKFVLIGSIRAVHQRYVRIRQQKLDLLPVGKETEGPHLDLFYAWSVAEPR